MFKPIAAAAFVLGALSTPVLAESHEPKPLLLDGDCLSVIEKIDLILETGMTEEGVVIELGDETRANVMELREQGATEQAAGDEAACTATLTLAIQLLNPEG